MESAVAPYEGSSLSFHEVKQTCRTSLAVRTYVLMMRPNRRHMIDNYLFKNQSGTSWVRIWIGGGGF